MATNEGQMPFVKQLAAGGKSGGHFRRFHFSCNPSLLSMLFIQGLVVYFEA